MSTISNRSSLTVLALSLGLFLSSFAFVVAQTGGDPAITNPAGDPVVTNPSAQSGQGALVNPLKVNSLEGLLGLIVAAAVRIGTIILVLALVWVGFLFVAARGREEQLRTARSAFFWTVIGGLVLLGAQGLSAVIQSTANTLGS